MKFTDPRTWWRKLPRNARIQLIASVLLVFAGTEILILAPLYFEIAVMIDAFGSVFVLAALGASIRLSLLRLRELLWWGVVRPARSALHAAIAFSDFGMKLPSVWLIKVLRADALVGQVLAVSFALLFAASAIQKFEAAL